MTSSRSDLRQSPAQEIVCFPASFAQQSLWFIDQLTPGRATYNLPSALRVRGELDLEILKRTVEEVARRHETLRTRFVTVRGVPQQVIEDQVEIQLPLVDLTLLTAEEEREAEAMRLAREEAQQPFDLQHAPLFRGKLLRLNALNHVLLLTMHHIISDAWSIGVLIEEVSLLYGAFTIGLPSPLPELPIQYADYSVWQRAWLEGGVLERQLAYWKQQLAGSSALGLPTDRPRPASQSENGALYEFAIEANLIQKLKKLAAEQGATLFMVMLAAFQTLLYRYSGQPDIAVGTPTAGRGSGETEKLIGFFINTLVLRVDLSGAPSFLELLQRTKEVTLEAYAHEDVPFEKLVEVLSPERSFDSTPLFQVMLVLQNAPRAELELGGTKLQPLTVENGTSKFELSMDLIEVMGHVPQGVRGSLEYNTDLFEKASMARMIDHFQMLLNGIVAEPTRSIATLPLLTADERKQVIEQWNRTEHENPERTVVELFEEQLQRSPGAIAVVSEEEHLTYRELNERANQLSWYLRDLGVGPEVLVGICVERSVDMLVGLLATLKAGGAYLPIDPDYPVERIKYMVEDSRPALLLTQERLQQRLDQVKAQNVVCLDRDWETIQKQRTANLKRIGSEENAAYVMYTSGSTGKAKGVVIAHRALSNQLFWVHSVFGLTGRDRVLQKASFSFDVSVEEILAALVGGAQLILAKPGGQVDIEYLVGLIREKGITFVDVTPSLLQAFLENSEIETCSSLLWVLSGGESLTFELQEKFFQKMSAELFNTYGPTETTVQSSYWRCRRGEEAGTGVPLGSPVSNTQLYVLDQLGEVVPVGVAGELCIAGTGLARGYLNRPELTAERFVPNPLVAKGKVGGQRLYRTGDQARRRSDGTLEYLGRLDQQVKIRGFRIELGEIEAALREYGGVKQAVVLAREDHPGDRRLVAYIVSERGEGGNGSGKTGPRSSELNEHLRLKLPEYMMPSAYVQMEVLPLNHNGKVDRKKLPKPDTAMPEEDYVGSRNPTEETLCRLWQEVLRRERVGVHDNFFKVGGHSLLAAQVATRIRESFKLNIPLRQMFESPTIAQLAKVIDEALQTAGADSQQSHLLPAIKRVARKAALLPAERLG
jgi:amino acid adenylation domain-containing protein